MVKQTAAVQSGAIHAEPTKHFFITMITRDITLTDCIFDLLDNSIDGARRQQTRVSTTSFDGYWAKITFGRNGFSIADNCGGIALSDAIDYAFHFGRRPDAPQDVAEGIGLYGIGMKRAIFKMGRAATVDSETVQEAFRVSVNVDTWEKDESWDFHYDDRPRTGKPGTVVSVTNLYRPIIEAFEDKVFQNELIKALARDYAFFLARGLKIKVGDIDVPFYRYDVRTSADIVPASMVYTDDGVTVKIIAGLIDDLPDEVPEELQQEKVDRYGWFVLCNDRVVLAADKTDRTVWGNDGFKIWHPQYNGFGGFVFFTANDPKKLPWTTTKREVDIADPIYRRALVHMKRISEEFTAYTNQRKADLTVAKAAEKKAAPVSIASLQAQTTMSFPKIAVEPGQPKTTYVTIAYQKPKREIDEIKEYLERPGMSARDVGKTTFEHFRKTELGK